MSYFKTNIKRGDARERTRNLENITIMGNVHRNSNTNFQTNILTFERNAATNGGSVISTNNHTSLLKLTKGYYNLKSNCSLDNEKAFSLEDGLNTSIAVTSLKNLCTSNTIYSSSNSRKNMKDNMTKMNFNYPVPIIKTGGASAC